MTTRELKVAIAVAVAAFVVISAESHFLHNEFNHRITQKIVISIGCGFTAWLAMNSWFKKKQ